MQVRKVRLKSYVICCLNSLGCTNAAYAVEMTMEQGYLSGAGEPGETSGTERRGVHQSLRVSKQGVNKGSDPRPPGKDMWVRSSTEGNVLH